MKIQFCPICGPKATKKTLYSQNFKLSQLSKKIFSARRLPDRLRYKTVQCHNCGLIYADSILETDKLAKLYKNSLLTYQDQILDLTKTYGYYLHSLENFNVNKNSLLEIGCGNGFFLLEAKRQGYRKVKGVEPSLDAIKKTPNSIKKEIKNTMFSRKLFKKNSFDVICFFQTFDHILNPNQFLKDCHYLLKSGGVILAINHNVESLQAKILKEKSPIIDIEHSYLYSPSTMSLIFKKNKFNVLQIKSTYNIYSLGYLFHLLPLPEKIKSFLTNLVKNSYLRKLKLKLKLGNLILIAKT
ncbi:MAG: class I SAM-dependent methyltransferase [Candidatus Beckwithbacteria bacterium]